MARRTYDLPWEATLWVYVSVLLPMVLLFWKRGFTEPFADGEVFLFAVPLLILVFCDLVTSVKRNWAEWSSLDRGVVSCGLIATVLFGIVTMFALIWAGARPGSGALVAYRVTFFAAVLWAVVVHELAVSESPLGTLGPIIAPSLEWLPGYLRYLLKQITRGRHVETPNSFRATFSGSGMTVESLIRRYATQMQIIPPAGTSSQVDEPAVKLLKAIVDADRRFNEAAHESETIRAERDLDASLQAARRFVFGRS
jgi:hypothetical protein